MSWAVDFERRGPARTPLRGVPEAGLRGARVVVTGGAGFIGSHIVDHLVDAGCAEIVVLDNFIRGRRENLAHLSPDAPVRLVEADIRQHRQLDECIRGSDIVFHQAAIRTAHCAVEPRLAFDVMVQATFDLVEICVAHRVKRLVVASSASVYGMPDEFPTAESASPCRNRTLYGAAKLFSEGLLRAFNETNGLDYVVLRYGNVYGRRMDVWGLYTHVLLRWIDRIARGLPPVIPGDGRETLDLVHVRDVAHANILAATLPVGDVTLNIGGGAEINLHDLAVHLTQAMGRADLAPERAAQGNFSTVPRRYADISAARRMLGYAPSVTLDAGLGDLAAWWRAEMEDSTATPPAAPDATTTSAGSLDVCNHPIATIPSEHHVP